MMQLLDDAQSGRFDTVLIWALSRFSRSVPDLYNALSLFERRSIDLISLTEPFDTSTPMGRAMIGIVGVFAQLERELTAERVRAAMAERAAQGKRTCNEVLGYDLDGKDGLIINDEGAEVVRYIYNRYLEYRNLTAVAELCTLRGYHGRRGGRLTAHHIRVILTRPIYAGYNSFMGNIYQGRHEPIVTVRQYNRVQQLLNRPTVGRKAIHPLQRL